MASRAEIISPVGRPAETRVLKLYENCSPLPLDVDKGVEIRAVSEFLLVLDLESRCGRIPDRSIPGRGLEDIGSKLHSHNVLLHVELHIHPSVICQFRKLEHVLVGRDLEEDAVVKMKEVRQCEVL